MIDTHIPVCYIVGCFTLQRYALVSCGHIQHTYERSFIQGGT